MAESVTDTFVNEVKQVLTHLYDLPYLQQHELIRLIAEGKQSRDEPAGMRLRNELIKTIETMKPHEDSAPNVSHARVYNLMRLHYVEGLSIQECQRELGVSERQIYRILKQGQLTVAEMLWARFTSTLAPNVASELSSLTTEVARLKPNLQPVDVITLIEWSIHSVQPYITKKRIKVSKSFPETPIFISSDQGILQQVLISLFGYTLGQIQLNELHVEIVRTKKGAKCILQWVNDNDAEELEEANPVVIELVELLGFQLEQRIHNHRHEIILLLETSGPTILIIDDNAALSELLARKLTDHNCNVLTSEDGLLGFELAKGLIPDVIMLDVMMPKTDGWEILQRIRNHPDTIDIPVIVCTVFNNPELANALGASMFLPKPVQQDDVLTILRQLEIIQ